MKIAHVDIPTIFAQYLDTAFMPKANGWQKFGAGAAAFVVQHRMPQIMEQYGPVMRMAGVLGEDGMIDLELAHNLGKFAMEKAGTVDIAGFIVDSSDVEQIYNIARAYAR